MIRLVDIPAVLSALLLIAAGVSAQEPKTDEPKAESAGTSEYFPAAAGNTWEYKTPEGKVTMTIVKEDEIGGKMCWLLESATSDGKKTTEYVRITAEGVFRHQASDQNVTPPLMFLKFPPKDGDAWEVDSKVLGKALKGDFQVSSGEVKVPAGTYEDVVIVKAANFKVDDRDLPHTYYFAKGVGMVKQVVSFAGQEIVLELEKFTPAK